MNLSPTIAVTLPSRILPRENGSRLRERRRLCRGFVRKKFAGHTPGHVGYEVESQGQKLLIWGDGVHMAAVQMPHPEVGIVFDVDGPTAIKSRAALFAELAQEKTLVGGANYAVPSAGSPAKGRDRLHLAADYVHELELINEMLRMRHGASSHFYFLGEQYGPQFILRMEPP